MNWKTTLFGILTVIGALTKILADLLSGSQPKPEDVVLVATGAGLIAAKDHNK